MVEPSTAIKGSQGGCYSYLERSFAAIRTAYHDVGEKASVNCVSKRMSLFALGLFITLLATFLIFVQAYGWSHTSGSWGIPAMFCTLSVVIPMLIPVAIVFGGRMMVAAIRYSAVEGAQPSEAPPEL